MTYSFPLHGPSCCLKQRKKLEAEVSQAKIPGIYDSISRFYDIWGRLTESHARDRALELAEVQDGQKVLEVAVGTGLAFSEIIKRNPSGSNIGIDVSKGMLKRAERRLRRVSGANYELRIGSAFLPFVSSE